MRRVGISMLLLPLLAASCQTPAPPPPRGYFGDTLSLDQVVSRVNENNERLPTIWSREHFEATIVEREKNKATHIDGYGNLMFASPNRMRLTAKNELADLFEMGSDGTHFWLHEKHDQIFWWGNYANLNGAGDSDVPVRPDMVMETLGIRPLDSYLLHNPSPVMRFNNAADAYMIDWQMPLRDHWAVVKEIWYDRQTLLPQRVLLFDAGGRVVMWARLSKFEPVETPGVEKKKWAQMASRYEISFPYTGSTMEFDLSDISLAHNGFPKEASFRMPDLAGLGDLGVRIIQVDESTGH